MGVGGQEDRKFRPWIYSFYRLDTSAVVVIVDCRRRYRVGGGGGRCDCQPRLAASSSAREKDVEVADLSRCRERKSSLGGCVKKVKIFQSSNSFNSDNWKTRLAREECS